MWGFMKYQLPQFVTEWQEQHTAERQATTGQRQDVPHVLLFTGAGLSAESGIGTFRGEQSVWNMNNNQRFLEHSIVERELDGFLAFHNARRKDILAVAPNAAHRAIAALATQVPVKVITQNIDDLHERAGSQQVLHLHGSILHVRPDGYQDEQYRLPWNDDIQPEQLDQRTHTQLRPDVVLYGEAIYGYDQAMKWLAQADIVIVVGTSLTVEPAASLLTCTHPDAQVYYLNLEKLPKYRFPVAGEQRIGPATGRVPELLDELFPHSNG
jgi:NAD-dependent deacetylase